MLLDSGNQSVHVFVKIGIRAHRQSIPINQESEALRHFLLGGHFRIADKDRHNCYLPVQGRLNLDPHKIARVIQSLSSIRGTRVNPTVADDRKKDIAFGNYVVEVFAEIDPERNRVNVLEDTVPRERTEESVIDTPGDVGTILSPVR